MKRAKMPLQRIKTDRKETPDTIWRCSSAETAKTMERQESIIVNTKQTTNKSDRKLFVMDIPGKSPLDVGNDSKTRNKCTVHWDRENTHSRQSSAVYRKEMLSRNISILCSRDSTSRNNSPFTRPNTGNMSTTYVSDDTYGKTISVRNDTAARSNSPTQDQLRNHSGMQISVMASQNNSTSLRPISISLSRNSPSIVTPRNTSPVYRTVEDREATGAESPNKLDEEIVKGNKIAAPFVHTSDIDGSRSPRQKTQEQQGHVTNEGKIHSSHDLFRESPRSADRTNLVSRGSSLMLGSGRVKKSNDIETLEIHFDNADYSDLLDHQLTNVFSVTIGTNAVNTQTGALKENKPLSNLFEVQLPKTYITKSGSLLLYSDRKVIREKRSQIQQSSANLDQSIGIQGTKVSRPKAYQHWRKLVCNRKSSYINNKNNTGCTKRDQRDYIGINSGNGSSKPYSWDYTVLPVNLIDDKDEKGIQTVSNLTEAVLAYRSTIPSSKDKYMAMMKQTRDNKTKVERTNEFQAKKNQRLSTWTREWIGRHSTDSDKADKTAESDNVLIETLRNALKKPVRTPANTPLTRSQHIYLNSLYKEEFPQASRNLAKVTKAPFDSVMSKYK